MEGQKKEKWRSDKRICCLEYAVTVSVYCVSYSVPTITVTPQEVGIILRNWSNIELHIP